MRKSITKLLRLLCLLIAVTAICMPVKAQQNPPDTTQWHIGELSSPDAEFKSVKERADIYFEAHPEMDSLNPMAKKTYKRWETYWQNRSVFVNNDTIITNLGEITRQIALIDYAISPTTDSKWTLITPDKSEFQNLGVITCTWSKPGNPDYILAGTESSGLWKTTDGGANWTNITDSYTGVTATSGFYYHYPFGVLSIAVQPENPDVILIAVSIPTGIYYNFGYGKGILKSIDGGTTWNRVNLITSNWNNNTGIDYPGISKIVFDPENPDWVYAINGTNIWFSTNLFTTSLKIFWDAHLIDLGSNYNRLKIRDIEILDIPNTTALPDDRRIFVSTDSYGNIPAQLFTVYFNTVHSWINITNDLPNIGYKDVIMISKDDEPNVVNVAYQIGVNGGTNNKFCVDRISVSLTNAISIPQSNYLLHTNQQGAHCSMFGYYFDSFEYIAKTFVVGGLGITYLKQEDDPGPFSSYRTLDYTNPFPASNDEGYGKNRKLHFGVRYTHNFMEDNYIYTIAGTEGGISRIKIDNLFVNISEFKNINGKGLSIQQFNDIATTKNNQADIIVGGSIHNGYWGRKDGYTNWDNYWCDDGGKVVLNDVYSDFLYAVSYSPWDEMGLLPNQYINGGKFLRSNLGLKLNSGINPLIFPYFDGTAGQIPPQQIATIPPLIFVQNVFNSLFFGGHDVYKSINNGDTWTQISAFPNNTHAKALKVIAKTPSNPSLMYAAFEGQTWCVDIAGNNQWPSGCHQTETHKLYKYTGSSWVDISQNVNCQNALSWAPISDILINPLNENEVWTTHAGQWSQNSITNKGINRVLFSNNGGVSGSWTDISLGLTCLSVNCIRFIKDNADPNNYMLIVGTDAGVYIRKKNDTQWTAFRDGMPLAVVTDIEIYEKERKIRAATWGRGIWEAEISCMSSNAQFYNIESNTLFETDKSVSGIIIQPGKTLTINSYITMSPNSTIEVKQGATLILYGGTLAACPGQLWRGIRVFGDNSYSQTIAARHGKVKVTEGTIKDAFQAIKTIDINNSEKGGGVIEINSGKFVNNMISIYMQEFKNPGNDWDNSYILNARFIVNDAYHNYNNNPFFRFIDITNIYKLRILGCRFENNRSNALNNNYAMNGIGIKSANSIFYVNTFCNDPFPSLGVLCPPQYSIKSEFRNLNYGIYATSDNLIKNFTVKNTTFDDNLKGIYAMTIDNAVFTNNTFKIIDFANAGNGCMFPQAYGMHLNTCSGYTVEGNLFDKATSSDYGSLGIVIHNSGNAINSIYNNTFKNIKYAATQPQDNNRGTNYDNGLKIKCNDYLYNKQDIKVLEKDDPPPAVVGISLWQGTYATQSPQERTFPAGNTFSHFGLIGTQTDFNNNDGLNINYYCHMGTNQTWIPIFRTGPPQFNLSGTFSTYTTKGEVCPSIAVTGNVQLTSNQINPLLTQSTLNYNSAKLILQIWVDGGNTPELVQTTELAYPWEAYTLYNELMAASPYLSDEVLIAAIQNEDGLPPLMLKLILLANPQAVRSNEVMDALMARNNPFPEEWLVELDKGLEVISPRENLEADVAYYATERKTYLDLLKKYHLEDTTANASQNLIQLLSCESDLESRYEMVFAQLANNEYTAANTTLDNMESILPENDLEISKYYKMRNIIPIIGQLNSGETTWENIDQSIVNELSENDDELPGMLAKSIRLRFDTAFIYEEPIYADQDEELRLSIPKNNNKLTVKSNNESFKANPNPANEFVVISYDISIPIKGLRLIICNALGKIVYEKELIKPKDELLITLKDYAKGNYIATLFNNGKIINSSKIVIK